VPTLLTIQTVALAVDRALSAIQTETAPIDQQRDSKPQDLDLTLQIEALSCCLRGQSANIAAIKRSVVALSTMGNNIDTWTGYSTILKVTSMLLCKVCNNFIIFSCNPFF
jgi:hypothetical protein